MFSSSQFGWPLGWHLGKTKKQIIEVSRTSAVVGSPHKQMYRQKLPHLGHEQKYRVTLVLKPASKVTSFLII